jgi:hypothetical protein
MYILCTFTALNQTRVRIPSSMHRLRSNGNNTKHSPVTKLVQQPRCVVCIAVPCNGVKSILRFKQVYKLYGVRDVHTCNVIWSARKRYFMNIALFINIFTEQKLQRTVYINSHTSLRKTLLYFLEFSSSSSLRISCIQNSLKCAISKTWNRITQKCTVWFFSEVYTIFIIYAL